MNLQQYIELLFVIGKISIVAIIVVLVGGSILGAYMAQNAINPEKEFYSSHDFPLIVEQECDCGAGDFKCGNKNCDGQYYDGNTN